MDNNSESLYYIWLTQIKGVGVITVRKLLNIFKSPEKIYKSNIDDLIEIEGIGIEKSKLIIQSKDLTKAEAILKSCYDKNIKISNINDNYFPETLKKYDDNPILLYYKGNLDSKLIGVAIVGSRRCTEYGKKVTVEAAEVLAKNNVTVISGMAKGIDSYAHTTCLKAGGFTAAILGCGADICYPKEHINLMRKIIDEGVIISEYPPGTPPKPEHFPKRNRIISSLSNKVLITEAGEKSGVLITAEYAIKQNKEIYVVSGDIYSKEFKGSNKLISEGVKIYLNPEQLLDKHHEIRTKETKDSEEKSNNTSLRKSIIEVIKGKRLTIDEITSKINCNKKELNNELFLMEIDSKVECFRDGKYGIVNKAT